MRVLVTGGTSLLGAATARMLADAGHDVAVMQRGAGDGAHEEYRGDITDQRVVRAAVHRRDAVVHLAARVGVVGSWDEFRRVNVEGTASVLEASRSAGVGRFVHVSSPSVAHTGDPLVGAAAEPAAPDGVHGHYARSKALAEQQALAASSDNFAVVAIRPHLVWGPGDTQLVGRIVERAKQGRLAAVGSGAALIDTTYVDNAAAALVKAVERAPDAAGRALVVSNGQPRPVLELVSRIVAAAGLEPPRLKVPYAVARGGGRVVEFVWDRTGRDDDPPMTTFLAEQLATAHWFDQRETQAILDWRPTVTLEEGFRRLETWFAAAPS